MARRWASRRSTATRLVEIVDRTDVTLEVQGTSSPGHCQGGQEASEGNVGLYAESGRGTGAELSVAMFLPLNLHIPPVAT